MNFDKIARYKEALSLNKAWAQMLKFLDANLVYSQKNGVNFYPFNAWAQSRKGNRGLRTKTARKRGSYPKIFAALRLGDFAFGFALNFWKMPNLN